MISRRWRARYTPIWRCSPNRQGRHVKTLTIIVLIVNAMLSTGIGFVML